MGEVAGVGDASAATPRYTRRVDTLLWLGGGHGRRPSAEPQVPRYDRTVGSTGRPYRSGHGVVLTLIEPSTICFFAASSLAWMSSMKPPLVASETPPFSSE
jgi:hypothetical protein